ncbi:MAG: VCBS repeat-containing protein, partial [Spirochaetes bacterium]|nr:VCBS repeat-containing protein [Spirochaetota bacterium]
MKKILLCGLLLLIITLNAGCSAELYLDDTIKRFNTDKITNSPLSDVQYDGPPPSVIFTYLPPVGSGANVHGMTYNAVGKYKISLWIKCSWGGQLRVGGWGWWPKTTFASPYAGISADGSWSDDYVVAGVDSGASTMVAFLVPINQEVYPNYSILNHAYANSVAYALSNRHNDVNTPTISITDPTSNVVTYNKYYTISGTYWDDRELYGLFVSLNSSAYYLAPNTLQLTYSTHSWSHTLTLKEGVNTFKVYTKDGTEKYSTIETGPTITYINAPISIENVRDNGIINTGVITGKATNYGDVSAVEYKLDNGVYQTAQGIENWSFRLPDGANSWLIGSRHTVSIRIRYLNGNYSTVITINIIKGINKDINGDGYEDLVTGSPGNGSQGLSYIFYGKTSGITSGPVSGADTTILCSDSGSFGSSITVGDINNDGYADLVVGDSSYNNNQGRVFIYYGSASGISSSFASSADLVITGIDYSKFGNSLALANVTGNGYMELLVGASNFENGKGAVYLFFGTSSGITVNKAIYANARLTGDVNSGFGHKIATADVNGDGYADLISSD